LKKIAQSLFVDERLIDELVKDIQRALLSADVNVRLVFELSKSIKERALKEEPPRGIPKKEHLVKIVYEELVKFLGEEKSEILITKKKPFKIMMVGLFGSGKCVHAKSNIVLGDGNILPIEELYKKYSSRCYEGRLQDGYMIDISNEKLSVPSFNPKTLKMENKNVTHLWKLVKESLVEVNLDNGNDFSVKVTPEHPFFVLKHGRVFKVRADELTLQDYVAVPRECLCDTKLISLFDKIKELNLFTYVTPDHAKKLIFSKYPTLLEANKNLKYRFNYCKFTSNIKRGVVPVEFIGEHDNFLKVKSFDTQRSINLPLFVTSEFAEFLGYVVGDGTIYKRYISIVSENPEIINRVCELSNILFGVNPVLRRDLRTKSMYRITLYSKTLVEVFKIFNLKPGKKGKNLRIPEQILLSDENVIKSFLRAYFDCDSYPSRKSRGIEITSESKILLQQVGLLLLRLGILSTLSKKFINNVPYWRLSIRARYTEVYSNKIGYLIKSKQEKISCYKGIGLVQGCGKQDMIPVGTLLRDLRISSGFSRGEIQTNAVTSYGIYEEKGLISRESLFKLINYYKSTKFGNFYKLFNDIVQNKIIKNKYGDSFINGISPYLIDQDLIFKKEGKIFLTESGEQFLQTMNCPCTEIMLKTMKAK